MHSLVAALLQLVNQAHTFYQIISTFLKCVDLAYTCIQLDNFILQVQIALILTSCCLLENEINQLHNAE